MRGRTDLINIIPFKKTAKGVLQGTNKLWRK